jgi:hypothetical protein
MTRLLLGLLIALLSSRAPAQTIGTCNGFINLDYTSLADPAFPACTSPFPDQHCTANQVTGQCECCIDADATITVSAQLGTGEILFGTEMDLIRLGFDPDCQPFVDPVCLARPGGPRVAWVSDSTITTDCGVTWSTGLADNTPIGSPTTIPFTPNPAPLVIPENAATPPGFCQLTFQLHIIADPGDSIFQLIFYDVAACNNGNLVSGGRQTAKVQVCPEVGPVIGYQIKQQGVIAHTGGSMDVPVLGIFGAAVPATEKLTARRLITPAKPNDIFGPHIVGFSDFDLPLPSPVPTLQITAPGLGTFKGKLGARSYVLINAVKSLVSQPPAPPLTDVWACYAFTKGLSQPVSWEDQFGPNTGHLGGVKRVCLPASLLGSTPPVVTYLCAANDPDQRINPTKVFIASAWLNAAEKLDGVDDFCVPATVVVQ